MDRGEQYADQSVPPPGFESKRQPAWTPVYAPASVGHRGRQHQPHRGSAASRFLSVAAAVVTLAVIAVVTLLLLSSGPSDAQIARAINLRPSDLPGWTTEPAASAARTAAVVDTVDPDQAWARLRAQLAACLGPRVSGAESLYLRGPNAVSYDAASRVFGLSLGTAGTAIVISNVAIEPSAAALSRQFAALRALLGDSAARGCVVQAMSDEISQSAGASGSELTGAEVQFDRVSPPVTAASQSVGATIGVPLTANGETVAVTATFDAWAVGRTMVGLAMLSVGREPPSPEPARLATLLVDRAEAQPH